MTTRLSSRSAALAALLLLAAAGAAPGASATETGWRERIRLSVALRASHDDNFLQYSDGQIATFDAGTNPDRYSVTSIDDALFEPSVSLRYELDRGRRGGRTIRLRWSGDFHGTNATADDGAGSVSWREEFAHGRSVAVGAYRLPNYYLRQLFDEDVPSGLGVSRYRRASFALTIGSVEYRQRLATRTNGFLHYRYERRTYDQYFRERTSDTHEVRIGSGWNSRGRRWDLDGTAGYRTSAADARDGDEATGSPADDPDVSYHGPVASARTRIRLSGTGAGRLAGEIGAEYERREYTSDRVSDTSHHGRIDRIADVTIGLRWNPPGPFSFRGFFRHGNDRATFASANRPSTDPASYVANQIGASVEWGATLWRR
ncbi:MAG: hypothetical protein ACM3JJ_08155 [Hyphomicrobiales bacterium]